MNPALFKKEGSTHSITLYLVLLTCIVSLALVSTFWFGGGLGQIATLVTLAWLPIIIKTTIVLFRQYRWFALLFILLVTQGVHFLEHCVQMVQIHILGLASTQAHGVISVLDTEWVHFVWNSWVLIFVVLLLFLFRHNPWLRVTLVASTWHEIEHCYLLSVYLKTGLNGTPGLLGQGGAIAGGLPIIRPDLHFYYNLIEEALLIVACFYQVCKMRELKGFATLSKPGLAD